MAAITPPCAPCLLCPLQQVDPHDPLGALCTHSSGLDCLRPPRSNPCELQSSQACSSGCKLHDDAWPWAAFDDCQGAAVAAAAAGPSHARCEGGGRRSEERSEATQALQTHHGPHQQERQRQLQAGGGTCQGISPAGLSPAAAPPPLQQQQQQHTPRRYACPHGAGAGLPCGRMAGLVTREVLAEAGADLGGREGSSTSVGWGWTGLVGRGLGYGRADRLLVTGRGYDLDLALLGARWVPPTGAPTCV